MTTPLSELVCRIALLSSPCACRMTVRLVQEKAGIELKACCDFPGPEQEFVRHVSLGALEHLGAAAVAREFARAARAAHAGTVFPAVRRPPPPPK